MPSLPRTTHPAGLVCILLASVSRVVSVHTRAEAVTWTVERDDSGDCAVVQDAINAAASGDSILIGPGRWGSNDVLLGVPVRYADINRCRMLIEVARQKDGFAPEVSYGTHFFQDLVEAGIHYLPLYPDEPGVRFNAAFLGSSANQLAAIVPADADFASAVRVIRVPEAGGGRKLTIAMDGETDTAIAFLK